MFTAKQYSDAMAHCEAYGLNYFGEKRPMFDILSHMQMVSESRIGLNKEDRAAFNITMDGFRRLLAPKPLEVVTIVPARETANG